MVKKNVSSTVAARERAIQKSIAVTDHLPGAAVIEEDIAAIIEAGTVPVSEKELEDVNAPQNWKHYKGRSEWINVITGEVRDRLPGEGAPTLISVQCVTPVYEQDDGLEEADESSREMFALTASQLAAGIRLAISEQTGMVRACPVCGRHQLVTVPRNGLTYLVCADALVTEPTCDFYELV